MIVLGLHGGVTVNQHEPSVCLIVDGKVVALCEEERYTRIKSSYGYLPYYSIQACLDKAKIKASDIDLVVTPGITYDFFKERISHYLKHYFGVKPRVECIHHQEAHLATAFYSSGYGKALCISLDATGDGSSGFVAIGSKQGGFKILHSLPTKSSIGFFYSLITHYLGFQDGDEYKVMGLAPYGKANVDLYPIIKPTDDGWNFDWSYLKDDPPGKSPFEPMCSSKLISLLGAPARTILEPTDQRHMDIACSAQRVLEECLLKYVGYWQKQYPEITSLCLSGGVAMNCVANEKIRQSGLFKNVFVPPFASDRGLSVGCAYSGARMLGDSTHRLENAYLGSAYSSDQIKNELEGNGIRFTFVENPEEKAADLLSQDRILGWYQGGSEAGARALGNRSILASPKKLEMKDAVNKRIKFREMFRPFAPAVLFEETSKYFDLSNQESPWMCFAPSCTQNASTEIPAVIHVDNTARVQTVSSEDNLIFHKLIKEFEKQTGTPVVLNTSFNLKGQPIVETPRDALMTFFGCGLDVLFLGNYLIEKMANGRS